MESEQLLAYLHQPQYSLLRQQLLNKRAELLAEAVRMLTPPSNAAAAVALGAEADAFKQVVQQLDDWREGVTRDGNIALLRSVTIDTNSID